MIALVVRELPIQFEHVVTLPRGARIVGACIQNGSPAILSLEDDSEPPRNRYIYVAAPGDASLELVEDLPAYVVTLNGSPFVIFDDGEPEEADVEDGGG